MLPIIAVRPPSPTVTSENLEFPQRYEDQLKLLDVIDNTATILSNLKIEFSTVEAEVSWEEYSTPILYGKFLIRKYAEDYDEDLLTAQQKKNIGISLSFLITEYFDLDPFSIDHIERFIDTEYLSDAIKTLIHTTATEPLYNQLLSLTDRSDILDLLQREFVNPSQYLFWMEQFTPVYLGNYIIAKYIDHHDQLTADEKKTIGKILYLLISHDFSNDFLTIQDVEKQTEKNYKVQTKLKSLIQEAITDDAPRIKNLAHSSFKNLSEDTLSRIHDNRDRAGSDVFYDEVYENDETKDPFSDTTLLHRSSTKFSKKFNPLSFNEEEVPPLQERRTSFQRMNAFLLLETNASSDCWNVSSQIAAVVVDILFIMTLGTAYLVAAGGCCLSDYCHRIVLLELEAPLSPYTDYGEPVYF
jgi:hypothetical protein